jgi:hypothetical protein
MNTSLNFDNTKAPRSRPNSASIRNPIALTLLWAAKADSRLVAVCSRWTIATQQAFGLFVFFTAFLAFGAAYYTLSTLNASPVLIPWISLGWSAFIFFLDREIVGGLDKMTAVIRPFLALFIGTIVAIPIELWVFQARVDQELHRQYREDNKQQLDGIRAAEAGLDQHRREMEAALAELRKQEAEWGRVLDDEAVGRQKDGRTGVAGAGPVFHNAQMQQASVRDQMQQIRHDLDQLEASLPARRERIEKAFQREEIGVVTNFVTRYEAMDRVVRRSPPLNRLSWLITLALILIEMTPALIKLLTPHADYHHLVSAEIRENIARIDEISDRNYRLAMEHPEQPEASVSDKFAKVRFWRVSPARSFVREA